MEIWQACVSGRYNNDKDPNPAPLDPHFKYWGETWTNASGLYSFKTIIPGSYPASPTWQRPAHIHYRVSKLGYHELTTQMYFKNDPLNEQDLILQNLAPEERQRVIIEFKSSGAGFDPNSLKGRFDLVLKSVS